MTKVATGHKRRFARAFTLIELATVLIVMGILTLIAIPVYTQLEHQNSDQAAESQLNSAQLAGRGVAAVVGSAYQFPTDLETQISLPQPLSPTSGASTGVNQISIYEISSTQAVFAVKSGSGNCLILYDPLGGTSTWGVSSTGTCSAQGASGLIGSITGNRTTPSVVSLPV